MPHQKKRPLSVGLEDLLKPITGANPCGKSLRYDPIYDQIREARREDDPTLSRGVWEYELKRADWSEVEKIASEALIHETKDLQIAGWLGEAWTVMDGIVGASRSFELLKELCEKFWPDLYPEIDNGDGEFRIQFFDWYDRALLQHFIELPIIEEIYGDEKVTLADWMSAVQFESVLKRVTDNSRLIQKAEAKGKLTLKKFNSLIQRVPVVIIQEKIEQLQILSDQFLGLTKILDQLMPDNTLGFHELKSAIDEMARLYQSEFDQRQKINSKNQKLQASEETINTSTSTIENETDSNQPNVENDPSSLQNQELTRQKAYAKLAEIADFLEKTEPHSPASQFLRHIVQWENKTLLDIINDLGSTPEEMVALMRFLGSPRSQIDKRTQ